VVGRIRLCDRQSHIAVALTQLKDIPSREPGMGASVHSAVYFLTVHRKVNPGPCLADRELAKGRFPSHCRPYVPQARGCSGSFPAGGSRAAVACLGPRLRVFGDSFVGRVAAGCELPRQPTIQAVCAAPYGREGMLRLYICCRNWSCAHCQRTLDQWRNRRQAVQVRAVAPRILRILRREPGQHSPCQRRHPT
jgi:hypothetical protein